MRSEFDNGSPISQRAVAVVARISLFLAHVYDRRSVANVGTGSDNRRGPRDVPRAEHRRPQRAIPFRRPQVPDHAKPLRSEPDQIAPRGHASTTAGMAVAWEVGEASAR
jgi:hypothetical protein